jgi:aminodeoxyfutalosine deaminase
MNSPTYPNGILAPWSEFFPHWDVGFRIPKALQLDLSTGPSDEAELDFARMVERAPKTELHVHIEAAVPSAFYQSKKPFHTSHPTEGFQNFGAFIEAWLSNSRLIGEAHDLEQLAEAFVAQRAAHNIVYTEAHVSLVDLSIMRRRRADLGPEIPFGAGLASLCRGLRSSLVRFPQIDVRIIADLLWLTEAHEKDEMVESILELHSDATTRSPRGGSLIIGVGLGGPERASSAPLWLGSIERCRQEGLLIDIHCGETASPSQAREACQLLRPHRISHGIAGAPHWIFNGPIAACPISNLLTGQFFQGLTDHPIGRMLKELPTVSINTDDPLLFGTNLTLEYVALRRALGWSQGQEEFERTQLMAQSSKFTKLI